jgi:purine-binding chemotaxis protein CheW
MENQQHLLFQLNQLKFGLDTAHVREIFPLPELQPIADGPRDVIGLLNLRGHVLPVMHLALRLGLPLAPCQLTDCVVVMDWQGIQVGMVVHQVDEVTVFDASQLESEPNYGRDQFINTAFVDGIAKVGQEMITLLNPKTLIRAADEVLMMTWEAELDAQEQAQAIAAKATLADAASERSESDMEAELFSFLGEFEPAELTVGIDSNLAAEVTLAAEVEPAPQSQPVSISQNILASFYDAYCPAASDEVRAIFAKRAEDLRQSLETGKSKDLMPLTVIQLDNDPLGVDLGVIREFISLRQVTPIPDAPDYILGNFNLRGEIIPLMDISPLIGSQSAASARRPKAVLIETHGTVVGVAVDEVVDVIYVEQSAVYEPPMALSDQQPACLIGALDYGNDVVRLLDLSSILNRCGLGNTLAA